MIPQANNNPFRTGKTVLSLTMPDCVFCKIIEGNLPCKKIYEDDLVVAILDHRPVRQGATMVIPKKHINHFIDLDDDLATHIIKIGNKIGRKINSELKPKRVGFAVAGFGVAHVHYHIIPMFGENDITSSQYAIVNDDKVKFTVDHIPLATDEEQNKIVELIKIDA